MENLKGTGNPGKRRLAVFAVGCLIVVICLVGYVLLGGSNKSTDQQLHEGGGEEAGDSPAKAANQGIEGSDSDSAAKNTTGDRKADLPPAHATDAVTENQHRQLIEETTQKLTGEARLQEEVLDVKKRTPLIKWQKERVDNIRRESIRQLIENLANFDDNHFARNADGLGYTPGWPRSEMIRIIHLSRVGRLMAEGRNDTALVVPLLKESLLDSLKGWPAAREARKEKWRGGSFSLSGPEDYERFTTRGIVATYVLAELGDYESLPLLMHSYKESDKWIAEGRFTPTFQYLVPPTITLYAMHQLVSKYPAEGLSEAAVNSRDAYLKWAEENLAKPTVVSRSAWNAEYDTSDPMVRITDPKGILHKVQQKIDLTVYPHRYKDGTWIKGGIVDRVHAKTQQWLDNIEPFVEAVTPESK